MGANSFVARCFDRRVEIGHFAYWLVSPIVTGQQHIRAGQQIGWSCRGAWHIHLSEWQRFRSQRVWVNPLSRGGPLTPYTDTARPVINKLAFSAPPSQPWAPTTSLASPDSSLPLSSSDLQGRVELRANIGDPQSFLGFLARRPAWPTVFTPYRVAVRIQSRSGRVLMDRVSLQADQMPQTPYIVHYRARDHRRRQHDRVRRATCSAEVRRNVLVPPVLALPVGVLEHNGRAERHLSRYRHSIRSRREPERSRDNGHGQERAVESVMQPGSNSSSRRLRVSGGHAE